MPSIAYVYSDLSELCFEYWVASLAFHIVSRLIKIANSWNMSFLLLSKDVAVVINHNSSIMESLFDLFTLEYRGYNDDVMFLSELAKPLGRLSINRLWELNPRISLACAHEKRSCPDLLQSNNIHILERCEFNNLFDSLHNSPLLLLNRLGGFENDLVLYRSHFNYSLCSSLLTLIIYSELLYFNVESVGPFDRLGL
jgi:hypothetical protein